MTLEHIETFLTVARLRSFHEAADALYTTPSTVSKHIASLEKEYNITLFHRTTKGVELTDSGYTFYDFAQRIKCLHDDFLREIHDMETAHKLRICSVPLYTQLGISELFERFNTSYPEYEIEVCEEHGVDILRLMQEKRYNLTICLDFHLDPEIVDWKILRKNYFVALLNKKHPLAKRDRISLAELHDSNFIGCSPRTGMPRMISKLCRSSGFEYKITSVTSREENIVTLVADNRGVALVDDVVANPEFLAYYGGGKVVAVPIEENYYCQVVLAKLKGTQLQPSAAKLWNLI